jgi:hypothetical protein
MRKLALTAALGAACFAVAACDNNAGNNAADENLAGAAGGEDEGSTAGDGNGTAAGSASASAFPKGARIVDEGGVTYRIDADGTRVRLGDNDSRIVVENGVRYRVDPGGSRVKINDQGIDIDLPDLTPDVDLPDVDVGINDKGNPDVDVKDKKDGNDGPN